MLTHFDQKNASRVFFERFRHIFSLKLNICIRSTLKMGFVSRTSNILNFGGEESVFSFCVFELVLLRPATAHCIDTNRIQSNYYHLVEHMKIHQCDQWVRLRNPKPSVLFHLRVPLCVLCCSINVFCMLFGFYCCFAAFQLFRQTIYYN